ncbi:MAG: glycosyltransferase [Smithellaceae bacterium]|nr:glycosyltransferase [Smithellaceae bacterium]
MKICIHICIVTTAHPTDDVRVNYKFAQAFVNEGFQVTWVGPGHAFFAEKNYNTNNIHFILTPPNRSRLDRLFSPSRVRRLAKTVRDVDVYYAPDPDAVPVALSLANKNGAKVIFDIHEVYHGALLDRWLMGWRLSLIRNYVRLRIKRICSKCSLVIGVSDSVLSPYISASTNSMVIRSCAPTWFAREIPADVCGSHRSYFNVMHGKSDLGRGTLKVLEAASIAYNQVQDLRIIMFRSTANDADADVLLSRINELKVSDVLELRPGVAMQEMPDILKSCDVGLVAYGRDLGVDSLPNRLFEYMAAGLAIIAPVYAREIAKIIDAEKCGVLADFEDPEDVARAIIQLRKNPDSCRAMGMRARKVFIERHNWEVEVRPLIDRMRSWFPIS